MGSYVTKKEDSNKTKTFWGPPALSYTWSDKGGYLSSGSETSGKTSEGLNEMFEGDFSGMCTNKFQLMLVGGQAEGLTCSDPGARTPISVSGIGPSEVRATAEQTYVGHYFCCNQYLISTAIYPDSTEVRPRDNYSTCSVLAAVLF
jgi:hypothetical protein